MAQTLEQINETRSKLGLSPLSQPGVTPNTSSGNSPEAIQTRLQKFRQETGYTPEEPKGPGFIEAVGERLKTPIENARKKNEEIQTSSQSVPSKVLQSGAQVAKLGSNLISETAGETAKRIPTMAGGNVEQSFKENIAQPIGDVLGKIFSKIGELPLGKGATVKDQLEAIGQLARENYPKFKEAHPELANNIEALGELTKSSAEIALAADTAGVGGAIVKKGAEAAIETVAPAVSKAAGSTAKVVEKGLEKQVAKEAINVTKKEIPTMTKGERESALRAGQVKEPGIFKKPQLKLTPEDEEIAKSVEGIVSTSKSAPKNIDAIRNTIADESVKIENGLLASEAKRVMEVRKTPGGEKAAEGIFNQRKLEKTLDAAKENSRVIFGSDKTLEKGYDAVRDEFLKILKGKSPTLAGVLDARKEFDALIKQKFPNIFDRTAGDNVRANAVFDVRRAANEYIADTLPEGNPFKAKLARVNNMYKAIDRIAEKSAIDQSKFSKLTNLIRQHPWLSLGAATGAGVGGAAVAGILTNPIAIGSLLTYGTYKLGKTVITSKALKEGLINFLRTTEKALAPEETNAIKTIINDLDQSLSTNAASSAAQTKSNTMKANIPE